MLKCPSFWGISEKDPLLLWLSLFRAETEEDLEKIKKLEVLEMGQAINAYYASSKFREAERLREKARHDEAQALYRAEQQGIQKGIQQGVTERNVEIARNLLKINLPLEQIIAATGLNGEEVENLRKEI